MDKAGGWELGTTGDAGWLGDETTDGGEITMLCWVEDGMAGAADVDGLRAGRAVESNGSIVGWGGDCETGREGM